MKVQWLKNKRTKIIATIGPASIHSDILRAMIQAGVNVFRLNFSHGIYEEHQASVELIRRVAQDMQATVAILADLCGPKIRTGGLKNDSIELVEGQSVVVTVRDVLGEAGLISSGYKNLVRDVSVGTSILLADGLMELNVEYIAGDDIHCRVIEGGILGTHKGINLPDASISAPALTEKDKKDAMFAMELGVDFLALSFVRSAQDMQALRALTLEHKHPVHLVAKIERPEALQDIEAILDVSDAIMVARGDLGIELPAEEVPLAQQDLIIRARLKDKPVIVATQVLESMIEHKRPTRAEVTDIFHSVMAGTDALMLSAETAAGKYPLAAVQTMNKTIRYAEGYLWQQGAFSSLEKMHQGGLSAQLSFSDAVAHSTALLSRDLMVRGIIVITQSGITAAAVSAARPEAPILAVSSNQSVCRQMNLMWGVIPSYVHLLPKENIEALAVSLAVKYGLASSGEAILLVSGFHKQAEKSRPSITVLCV